jgi:RNA polymerase sigma-70 factor (ECF subfamily)
MPEAHASAWVAPDEQLVSLARGGDRLALEELFRRHFSVAVRVARRLLDHEQDAFDAVQDAAVKAIQHFRDFDGRSGFQTWWLRIVTNAALDVGRKRRRRSVLRLADPADGGLEPAVGDDPALGLYGDDLRKALTAALGRLKPAIRTTFVLFAEAGMSYQEVADCLNIPIGTVMSRIHSARSKLQSYLEGVEAP